MTPAQQQREIARQAARDRGRAARPRCARRERQREADAKAAAAAEKARQKTIDTAIRTGGKVVTSRVGQDFIRGVFGTIFGGKK